MYSFTKEKRKICKINYAQISDIDHYTHYITYLSFQRLRNHRILQQKNHSFLYLKVLVKPELSIHGPRGH